SKGDRGRLRDADFESRRPLMLSFSPKFWRRFNSTQPSFTFDRPLLVLQSDDWGRVGVRDQEGLEQLRTSGIAPSENPYDLYTLETADDVIALRDLLKRHRDTTGRAAPMTMNFVMSNLDFARMSQDSFQKIVLLPLDQGLPGSWKRPGLVEAYRQGIN